MSSLTRMLLMSILVTLGAVGTCAIASAQTTDNRTVNGVQQAPHRHTPTCRQWVPPQTKTIQRRVWVPGGAERIWVPAVYQTRYNTNGNPTQVLVKRGYHKKVPGRGRYVVRSERLEVPGRWQYMCGH